VSLCTVLYVSHYFFLIDISLFFVGDGRKQILHINTDIELARSIRQFSEMYIKAYQDVCGLHCFCMQLHASITAKNPNSGVIVMAVKCKGTSYDQFSFNQTKSYTKTFLVVSMHFINRFISTRKKPM